MKLFLATCCLIAFSLAAQQSDMPLNDPARKDSTTTDQESQLVIRIETSQRVLPIESYFRDRLLLNSSYLPLFPINDETGQYNRMVTDTKPRYSDVGHYLYNRELIQIKERNNQLWITPLFDISMGRDLTADSMQKITQNTRGVRMEGSFNSRVFFSTAFFENQAILPDYAAAYAKSKGEFYPNQGASTYFQQNAVISGAARTKPFGDNGFDYAYAVGFVSVKLANHMSLSVGNNSLFVGSGYRSMLWSDHSLGAMNIRYQYNFARRWWFQVVRMRGMNMLRRLGNTNAEAYYEPTSLSMSSVYYSPSKNIQIGLFEGGVWDRGDSLYKKAVSPWYYVPLPGASLLGETIDGRSNTVLGIDANVRADFGMFYGQFAMNPMVEKSTLFQLGMRLNVFDFPGAFVQVEYNQAGEKSYVSNNPRMNYASYNLPLAHPAGTDFQELLFRGNFEYDHWFVSTAFHYYPKQVEQSVLLPIYTTDLHTYRKVVLSITEIGYHFNRSYGLDAFVQFRYRKGDGTTVNESSWISAGIRTAIRNHYYDY